MDKTRISKPWIPLEKLLETVQLEPALVLLGLALGAFFIYRVFMRNVSKERHLILQSLFVNLILHITLGTVFFALFWILQFFDEGHPVVIRLLPYLGLIGLISGCVVLVKVARIYLFEYLFLGHMKEGVPLLLVNIFTLLMSIVLAGWIANDIFGVRLTPVLATSAIFSIVLGLALQDTLGNLFAGVALQLDKPYEIGDWIEINSEGQRWVGQVQEISWRSTILLSFTDEAITIPNRTMAQAQVSNFSPSNRNIARSLIFRVPFGTPLDHVRSLLVQATKNVPQLVKRIEPLVLVSETTDSWVTLKLVYWVESYGSQYLVADQVYSNVIRLFDENRIGFASPRITVLSQASSL